MQRKYIGGAPGQAKATPAGAFYSLGGIDVGRLIKSFGYVRTYIKGQNGAILYLSKGQGGGYFTNKMRQLFVKKVKEWAMNPSELPGAEWEPYHEKYQEWKSSNYPGSGPWVRTGLLLGALGPIRTSDSGQTVGFNPKFTLVRHGFGKGSRTSHGRYTADTIASRMEYGFRGSPGMPARPLFEPSMRKFLLKYYPQAIKVFNKAVMKAHDKNFRVPGGDDPTIQRNLSTGEWSTSGGIQGAGGQSQLEGEIIKEIEKYVEPNIDRLSSAQGRARKSGEDDLWVKGY